MDLFPSEYQQLNLNRYEKVFIRHAINCKSDFGMLILSVNPAMLQNENVHIIIIPHGVLMCKFLPLNNAAFFPPFIKAYFSGIYTQTKDIVHGKLKSNKCLVNQDGELNIRFSYVCIFPELKRSDIMLEGFSPEEQNFIQADCLFAEDFSNLRGNFLTVCETFLDSSNRGTPASYISIGDQNVNSVLQRVTPEYTTVRLAALPRDTVNTPGVDEELLVVTDDDVAVRAFRLEPEQINIVNKMVKGDQLILACAGSGKSVLLIAKCFKAAKMNPEKKFLITCYNRNLQSLYTWFIERAGLLQRNVDCYTFDGLCKHLLEKNKLHLPTGSSAIEARREAVFTAFNKSLIPDRYYGIFIDEVQMFEQEWYKLCYNLVENKDTGDHLFVICGDKTQEIKKRQKHGRAPWNVGEGYPSYRGGNKSIRIEKNFRNCIEINEFINRFADNARKLVMHYSPDEEYDPDLFLRGQAFRHGTGVKIKEESGNALVEADKVVESIKEIHDEQGIPYDEIAVAFYNKRFNPLRYYLESALIDKLSAENIPFNRMYHTDAAWASHYGDGGVSLITFDSVLGLDFQAVIVCGLKPLGVYDKTKRLKSDHIISEDESAQLKKNISYLYVACTRAKDCLHIILTEKSTQSIYTRLVIDSK